MLFVYLDPYHLGDPLFLTQLARDLAYRGGGALLMHGSGEAGERALEATGAVVRESDGVWEVSTPEEAAVVERAARELNRQIVHELNEAGVPAIRVMGADRGLLKKEGGAVRAGSAGWVADLVAKGGVAVLASLVRGEGDALVEVEPLAAVGALAGELATPRVVLLSTGSSPGQQARDERLAEQLQGLGVDASILPRADLRSIPAT